MDINLSPPLGSVGTSANLCARAPTRPPTVSVSVVRFFFLVVLVIDVFFLLLLVVVVVLSVCLNVVVVAARQTTTTTAAATAAAGSVGTTAACKRASICAIAILCCPAPGVVAGSRQPSRPRLVSRFRNNRNLVHFSTSETPHHVCACRRQRSMCGLTRCCHQRPSQGVSVLSTTPNAKCRGKETHTDMHQTAPPPSSSPSPLFGRKPAAACAGRYRQACVRAPSCTISADPIWSAQVMLAAHGANAKFGTQSVSAFWRTSTA